MSGAINMDNDHRNEAEKIKAATDEYNDPSDIENPGHDTGSTKKIKTENDSSDHQNDERRSNPTRISNILHKYDSAYELKQNWIKLLIIFNNINISGHSRREGSEIDEEALTRTFQLLRFTVLPYVDRTKDDILNILRTYFCSRIDFPKHGCIFIAFLTHGKQNQLKGSDGMYYSINDIWRCLDVRENQALANIPTVLLIQSCRGTEKVKQTKQIRQGENMRQNDLHDDNMEFYSCRLGHVSERSPTEGSPFIQELCNLTKEMADTHHFREIADKTITNCYKSDEKFNTTTLTLDIVALSPVYKSNLIKNLYLRNPQVQRFIDICFSLVEWMLATKDVITDPDFDVDDNGILSLQKKLQEYKQLQDNIFSTGQEIQNRSKENSMVEVLLDCLYKIEAQFGGVSLKSQFSDEEKLEQMMNTVKQLITTRLDLLESTLTELLNFNENLE